MPNMQAIFDMTYVENDIDQSVKNVRELIKHSLLNKEFWFEYMQVYITNRDGNCDNEILKQAHITRFFSTWEENYGILLSQKVDNFNFEKLITTDKIKDAIAKANIDFSDLELSYKTVEPIYNYIFRLTRLTYAQAYQAKEIIFRELLKINYNFDDSKFAEKLIAIAYEKGHSEGFSGIENGVLELLDLWRIYQNED